MKAANNFARLSAVFVLGFLMAVALLALRDRREPEKESLVYSEIAASLGKNVVILNRLNSNDVAGATFVLETSLDGALTALHFRNEEVALTQSQKKVLAIAKEYRRNHPFVSTNYGVVRGEGVEELINRITEK